jgi:hypothetical protein
MKRLLLILAAIVVTGGIAAAPAVAGLAGNPSFRHQIPVPAPSKAQQPSFADDHGRDGAVTSPASTASKSTATAHPEPGDDHGGATPHAEPSDDHGGGRGGHHDDGRG